MGSIWGQSEGSKYPQIPLESSLEGLWTPPKMGHFGVAPWGLGSDLVLLYTFARARSMESKRFKYF